MSINLNDKQKIIAESRYLKTDRNGNPKETVDQMFKRIAKYIASAEKLYKTSKTEISKLENEFYEIFSSFKFLSGMVLHDRGRCQLMPECFVLPLEDSLESIYKTLYQSVQLHRLGAGIGYDFSNLRPEGTKVNSTGKEASGPISFMRLFDFSSEIILNRGSARHAGHMGILRIDHPDIEKFIVAKQDYKELTNFNLSIAITDDFMKALRKDSDYKINDPISKKTIETKNARRILEKIADSIHKSGEPGIIFIDEINRKNTLKKINSITAVNLCGEQPLLAYESCNLGSLVLPTFVENNKINWKELERVTRLGVRFLDNVIDLAWWILPESEQIVKLDNRKIGLGIMGFADMLSILNMPYEDEKSYKFAEKLMKFINETAHDESQALGKIKGNFKNFKKSEFFDKGYKHMRNATCTTIAPTGTISLFADCNGGIEPFFAIAYKRLNMETLGDQEFVYFNKILETKLKDEWLYSKKLVEEILQKGSIQDFDQIPDKLKNIFKTSNEIDPKAHLMMQASFQKYTDNAVSKTINVAEQTTQEKIKEMILTAYDLKLKGLTIYRNKSRDKQVLEVSSN